MSKGPKIETLLGHPSGRLEQAFGISPESLLQRAKALEPGDAIEFEYQGVTLVLWRGELPPPKEE